MISAPTINWRSEAVRSGFEEVRRLFKSRCGQQPALEQVERTISVLSPLLRSKPDNHKELADALSSATRDANLTGIVAVLASPTADREAPYFIECANRLRECLGISQLDVILIRWENVIEQQHQPECQRNAEFNQVARTIGDLLTAQDWDSQRLHIIDVSINYDQKAVISAPHDFALADEKVRLAAELGKAKDMSKSLIQDLKWAVEFYGRQDSLSRLGTRQPLMDLAIRREIGRAVSARTLWSGQRLARHPICLTSEMTPRLVKCYRLQVANLNIAIGNQSATQTNNMSWVRREAQRGSRNAYYILENA